MPTAPVHLTWNGSLLLSAVRDRAQSALTQAMEHGVQTARPLARVDTGAMRDSIHSEVTEPTPNRLIGSLSMGDGLPDARAIFNELGTYKLAAQPAVGPGGDSAASFLKTVLA